ncbi:hypothetical protein [Streptomyces sp. 1222.5]|uniref:hypothetical protein n=1 Tax=Streptomyces sp. 1222.5 TaxID=1881026 RepID=UPI003D74DD55
MTSNPDPIAYGPTGYRCGCGKTAHSNLVPCQPEEAQPLDLDAIATRANAATPGPWCTDSWEIYQGTEYEPGLSLWIGETCRGTTSPEQDRADAAFVAAARTDVPALLAEVRALRNERDELRGKFADAAASLAEQVLRYGQRQREHNADREELEQLRTALTAIRHLHKDSPMGPCPTCMDGDAIAAGGDGLLPYPCPTGRLAGAQDCEPPSFRAARYAAAGNEMAASLVRDGFGDDEIAEILARRAAAPAVRSAD